MIGYRYFAEDLGSHVIYSPQLTKFGVEFVGGLLYLFLCFSSRSSLGMYMKDSGFYEINERICFELKQK